MYHLYLDLFSAKSARQNRTPEQEETRDDVNLKQNYEQKYLWEIHRSVDTEQYRNVAIEVWEEDKNGKKSQNMDHHLHKVSLSKGLCVVQLQSTPSKADTLGTSSDCPS